MVRLFELPSQANESTNDELSKSSTNSTRIATTSSHTKPKQTGFMDLPQELQDKIYEFYYADRHIELYCVKPYGKRRRNKRAMVIYERPDSSLRRLNRKTHQSISAVRARSPCGLHVTHDEEKGLTMLQTICSKGPRYDALRAQITHISIGRFNGQTHITRSLDHAYNLVAIHFPRLREVTMEWNMKR